jgi:long-chain acyl-CoA synthetase
VLPQYARIHHFTLLEEPFSQDRGELTPTLKIKRREVMHTRSEDIEAMYTPNAVPVDTAPASR